MSEQRADADKLPWGLLSPEESRARSAAHIERALATMKSRGAKLDDHEIVWLVSAMKYFAHGYFASAAASATAAATAVSDRSPLTPAQTPHSHWKGATVDRFSVLLHDLNALADQELEKGQS